MTSASLPPHFIINLTGLRALDFPLPSGFHIIDLSPPVRDELRALLSTPGEDPPGFTACFLVANQIADLALREIDDRTSDVLVKLPPIFFRPVCAALEDVGLTPWTIWQSPSGTAHFVEI